MSWNSNTEAKLRKYWKLGYSGSKIAKLLGGSATRNSVLGKSFRLKLEARAVSKKTTSQTHTKKDSSTEINNQKLGRKAKFRALLLDKNFEPEKRLKLPDLTNEHCKWPLGEKLEPATLFCGRKSLEKFSYCRLHILWAFTPKNAKEEDIVTEEDIPKFIQKKIKSA